MALVVGAKFKVGDRVRVRVNHMSGHCRTPYFVQGQVGDVVAVFGQFPNPEQRAYGGNGLPYKVLYQVRFVQRDLWATYEGPHQDTLCIDIFEHWLESMT
jgi:hypothetical protein